jgi:hypothetical protein
MVRPVISKAMVSVLFAVMFLSSSSRNIVAKEQTYTPRSSEEVDVISLVVASEIQANNWAKSELVCFSVNGLDPTEKLVKSLRHRNLNVRSSAEWSRKFNCGFELQLEYTQLDLSESVKVRSKVVDLREINRGEAHIATLLKDGEYSLHKVDAKWSINQYATKPLTSLPSS